MRSQPTKPLPRKGTLSKATVKTSPIKVTKKKGLLPKKTKALVGKTVAKSNKKSSAKDEAGTSKADDEPSIGDTTTDSIKSGASKTSSPTKATSRSNSPTKKASQAKQLKQKKTLPSTSPEIKAKKGIPKKLMTKHKKTPKSQKNEDDNDDIKYKINLEAFSEASKVAKVKKLVKKGTLPKKKLKPQQNDDVKETVNESNKGSEDKIESKQLDTKKDETPKEDNQKYFKSSSSSISSGSDKLSSVTPKLGVERPPKFFTSSRTFRVIDTDTQTFKTTKLFNQDDSKTDSSVNEKSSNTLVAQGPEIDVYTFTEKVDSPKSILSDFRKSEKKSEGKIRPIARVKGPIIDKKADGEKKYSSHRPIEEVVQQLIASKRSEELSTDNASASSFDSSTIEAIKPAEEKPIVSKSYKMVARKTSIPGKPFSPIKFLDQDPPSSKNEKPKKMPAKSKRQAKTSISDDDLETCKFALNTKSFHYSSTEESDSESNDDHDVKESSESDSPKGKKTRNKKYKKITESKELRELSRDTLNDGDKPSKRRLKLLSMWSGPKKHRMASLNALAKVHCLYENESRSHMELGLLRTIDRPNLPSTSKPVTVKKKENKPRIEKEKQETTSESEYETKINKKDDSSESSDTSDDNPPQRSLRGEPGIRSAGKYWDPRSCTSSSDDSEMESLNKPGSPEKKKYSKTLSPTKLDTEKSPAKMKKTAGVPVKKKRNRTEVVMDLKDMVVQKRMASLNATAILAASYEKRSPKSSKDETTSDSCSDESFSQKSKNVVDSGVKSEVKIEETKKEPEDSKPDRKVEVIVNQDTDVTITGVYSTHRHEGFEGFCTQYRISSTSHTQTTATANCEKQEGCSREESPRYTPLSALSSMQPPAENTHKHPHPVPELGGLSRRPGCSSAFTAPSPAAHHDPGYYQPAGPLIKEPTEDRSLARYHPPPHYHQPHPPVLPPYPPYYPPELCYGQYYRRPGPYHLPPQPDPPMMGVAGEPYPPPQYYGTPPCYQHSPQRIPYEYRGCTCPVNTCPKNVLIGPATGKAPAGGGPDSIAAPSGAFRKVRTARDHLGIADLLGSGKDPPLESEPPAAADAPHPCPVPAIGGASPKRELFDARDNMRLAGDLPCSAEALGPPSPARGSAGVCAPQPPTVAPRRARLGKAMARRSLAGDDTGLLMSAPRPPAHSDGDDDVLAISPPLSAPIDLSSSDERSTPLVDVKKENEGPIYTVTRKPDAQALREHNTTAVSENTDAAKPVKRRYSRPKLEIDMNNTQLEESLKTNGIGEHVKLQKRRKVSGDQTNTMRIESVPKEPKKKTPQTKRTPRTPEKKSLKRKSDGGVTTPKAKRMLMKPSSEEEARNKSVAMTNEDLTTKPKIKSALLLDNLIRKNSVDAKGYASDKELNPAELFLTPVETPNKKTNINNNIVENSPPISGVRPNTIAAVTQLIEKKLAYKKACKLDKVDSKIMHTSKSVLNTPASPLKCKPKYDKGSEIKSSELNDKVLSSNNGAVEDAIKSFKVSRVEPKVNSKNLETNAKLAEESHTLSKNIEESNTGDKPKPKDQSHGTPTKVNGQMKNKSIETVAKLLGSKKPQIKEKEIVVETSSNQSNIVESIASKINENSVKRRLAVESDIEKKAKNIEKVPKLLAKPTTSDSIEETPPSPIEQVNCRRTSVDNDPDHRKHLNAELKPKHAEKVAKLMVSKRPTIKTDEALEVVEDACASPLPALVGRRARRRRSGATARRMRRPPTMVAPLATGPKAPPRWSNGWKWDGDSYVNQVYINNDSRLDRTARCWQRMTHASGDTICRGDCVLLRASTAKAQPFVARVASLWENADDGEMMVSLVWYYRPEHTERGRVPSDAPDEVFASRHRDANSVACIEDKCYVLTFNEYCRYRKRLKATEERVKITPSIVPPLPASEYTPLVAPKDSQLPPNVPADLVMFCRKIYDFRLKKLLPPSNK